MILQSLVEYYERKVALGSTDAAPRGWQWKDLPFLIVIDGLGRFVALESTAEGVGKSARPKPFLVPIAPVRAGKVIRAGLLWDQLEYALGANPRHRDDVRGKFDDFRRRIEQELGSIEHPSLSALRRFLETEPAAQVEAKLGAERWEEFAASNPFVAFRLEGHTALCDELRPHFPAEAQEDTDGLKVCSVTGRRDKIPSTHSKIKGVWGAQSAGATLVSFNLDSARSFGKDQNANAQIGEAAADAYTKAINMLLDSDTNRVQFGDASVVFWSQKLDTPFEAGFRSFFASPQKSKDDPDTGARDARQALQSVLTGIPVEDGPVKFFVMGLAPNAARISVRSWLTGTVGEFAGRLSEHLADLKIVLPQGDPERMGLTYLLGATVFDGKAENVPPNLAGNVLRAVLSGAPYPEALLQQVIRRVRADHSAGLVAWRVRAALLKASLNRKLRRSNPNHEKEITVSLDPTNTDPGYRLGRLFATLEKIQEDASPGINATIRDRFYGSASSNPVAAFPQLLKLSVHNLAKMEKPGLKIARERLIGEILAGFGTDMPAHLSMDQQAKFAIGYYHQRQDFYAKKEKEGDQE